MDLSWQAYFTLGVTAAIFITLQLQRRASTDILFLGALLLVTAAGILPAEEAFSGFSNPAVLTIAGLLAITAGLRTSGVLDWLGHKLLGSATTEKQALARLTTVTTAASAFLLNTAVVAMLMPVVVSWCRRRNISPSRLLLPVSYLAILGGVCTLIGTSTTLVVNGELQQRVQEGLVTAGTNPLSLFELAAIGVPCALIGSTFLLTLGPRLLPFRSGIIKQLDEQRREYLVEMSVELGSLLVGQTVEQAGLRHLDGLFLIEIDRAGHIITPVTPNTILAENDILVFTGAVDTIVELEQIPGLVPRVESEFRHHPERHLVEVVLSRKFPLLQTTIREASFRQRYNAAIVAVHREGERLQGKVGDITLQAGDTLLLQTGNDFVSTYRNSKDFYLVSSVEGLETRHHQKARTALLLLICLLAWLILGSLFQSTDSPLGLNSPAVASLAIAVLMVLTRCLKPSDARNSINLQVLLTIAAALGLGKALSASGAAEALAHSLISTGGTNPIWLLIAIYLITVGLTETISNNAVAAMLLPLAIEIAEVANINARPLIIAITLAASLSFITPIGYQTNLMVMGPGGYRSRDYLKCGIPLALLMGVSALIIIPLVWPFSV